MALTIPRLIDPRADDEPTLSGLLIGRDAILRVVRAIGAFSKAGSFGRFHSTSTGRKPKLRATVFSSISMRAMRTSRFMKTQKSSR